MLLVKPGNKSKSNERLRDTNSLNFHSNVTVCQIGCIHIMTYTLVVITVKYWTNGHPDSPLSTICLCICYSINYYDTVESQ